MKWLNGCLQSLCQYFLMTFTENNFPMYNRHAPASDVFWFSEHAEQAASVSIVYLLALAVLALEHKRVIHTPLVFVFLVFTKNRKATALHDLHLCKTKYE